MLNKFSFILVFILTSNLIIADVIGTLSTYVDNSYTEYVEDLHLFSEEFYNKVDQSLKEDDITIFNDKSIMPLLKSKKVTGSMNFIDMIINLDKPLLFSYIIDNNLLDIEIDSEYYLKMIDKHKPVNIKKIIETSSSHIFKNNDHIYKLVDSEILVDEKKTKNKVPVYETTINTDKYYIYRNRRYGPLKHGYDFHESNSGSLLFQFFGKGGRYLYSENKNHGPFKSIKQIIVEEKSNSTYLVVYNSETSNSLYDLNEILIEGCSFIEYIENDYYTVFIYGKDNMYYIYIPGVINKKIEDYRSLIVDKEGFAFITSKTLDTSGWQKASSPTLKYLVTNNLELGPYETLSVVTSQWFKGYVNGEFYLINRLGNKYGPFSADSKVKAYFQDILTLDDKIINTPLKMEKLNIFERWTRGRNLILLNKNPLIVLTNYGKVELGNRSELLSYRDNHYTLKFYFEDGTTTIIERNRDNFTQSKSITYKVNRIRNYY